MKRPTLLTTLLVPTLLTILIGLTGFGFYLDGVESANRLADIDEELVRAASADNARQIPSDAPPPPDLEADDSPALPETNVGGTVDPPVGLVVDVNGTVLQASGGDNPFTADELAVLATQNGFVTTSDGDYRLLVDATPEEVTSLTALPLSGFNSAVADFRRALLVGGLVVVILEGIVVWLVARTVSRPVTRMTNTATRVADGELDTTIEPPSGTRETADLAADLERMLARLRSTLESSESSAADARAARDQMERFLADVSHEFRTPLTALHGYSDLHAKGMLDDEALERAMQRMGSESARLNGLVTDMMQLARKGSTDGDPEVFDVADVIGDVVDDLRSAHPGRSIDCRIPSDIDGRIAGVRGQIHQAVLNLGANACGHSDDEVLVEMTAVDTHLEISVIDHGSGIDEDDRERIFQPFVRLAASRARTGTAGAGLGLALTNQIVASHHGSIRVSDTLGGGATITLRIPRAA
ncbi:MAG: HAMP domain-containing sensor histidine kinase, partial [Ilumatobacter sp.]|uniref:sensor histidine kinase n=1 Tax=Ilumatobacter sp. TaxID=1967498 RepID=UPI003C72F5C3